MATGVSTTPEPAPPPRRRRWVPLSLRIFLALLAILSAVTAWEGLRMYRQQVAIREIERLGGKLNCQPDCPKWLLPWLGTDQIKLFDRVEEVQLSNTRASDETMGHLRCLTRLKGLYLDGTQITDVGLASIRGSTELEDLMLDRTRITDAGVAHMQGLAALEKLSLSETQITDAGLAQLKTLARLKLLHLAHTHVTDAGVDDLKRTLPNASVWKLVERDDRNPWPPWPNQSGIGFM